MQDGSTDQHAAASGAKPAATPPVWHRPAWITAMVGLVSAFLTVPQVVGDYLAKQQAIEATRIQNEGSVQGQALELVQNTLSQQGDERIFMLRFFAATLQDPQAKAWAEGEVARLDALAVLQGQLDRQRLAIEAKETEIAQLRRTGAETASLQSEISALQAEISQKNLEVTELRQQAGVNAETGPALIFAWQLDVDWQTLPADTAAIEVEGITATSVWYTSCSRLSAEPCHGFAIGGAPRVIEITGLTTPARLTATRLDLWSRNRLALFELPAVYTCTLEPPGQVCRFTELKSRTVSAATRG